jgi:hypothetical protein
LKQMSMTVLMPRKLIKLHKRLETNVNDCSDVTQIH